MGVAGRGLWGCSVPAPSCAQQNACSSPSSGCQAHPSPHGQQSSGCGGVNTCGNNINVCHTCPAALRPYMASNNVFVIPAMQVQQQPGAGGGGLGSLGNLNLNQNNLNTLLSGLGLAMGPNAGLNDFGGGIAGPAMTNGPTFSCRGCHFQM